MPVKRTFIQINRVLLNLKISFGRYEKIRYRYVGQRKTAPAPVVLMKFELYNNILRRCEKSKTQTNYSSGIVVLIVIFVKKISNKK